MRILRAFLLSAAVALPASAQSITEQDRRAIAAEVIKMLREDPSTLVEAIADYRARTSRATEAARVPVSGNLQGDVTVFEFPDYGCEACRAAAKAVDEAAAKDGSMRVVHHDYPASGVNAAAAATDIIAAYRKGQDWLALRKAYIESGVGPEARIEALADAGIEPDPGSKEEALKAVVDNRLLAIRAGVGELPAVIVARGNKVLPIAGAITSETILQAAGRLRSAGAGEPRSFAPGVEPE